MGLYDQNVANIESKIQKLCDMRHIIKLLDIFKQIKQCLDNKQDEMIGSILISLNEQCKNGKIKMNENVFSKIKPLHECLQNLTKKSKKKFVVKKAKNLLSEWSKYNKVKVNNHSLSGKKRKFEKKNQRKQRPKKRQKVVNKIRDCSESESQNESDFDNGIRRRRSLRKCKKKNGNVTKSKIMQSDIYGNESEDDTMSDDERNERLQLKTDRNFIKNKRKNKKRIDLQQQSNENIKKVLALIPLL